MATFPITNPSYGTRIESNPAVNVLSFGDGFEQRLTEASTLTTILFVTDSPPI